MRHHGDAADADIEQLQLFVLAPVGTVGHQAVGRLADQRAHPERIAALQPRDVESLEGILGTLTARRLAPAILDALDRTPAT